MKQLMLCLAVLILLAAPCAAQDPRGPFADVPTGHWVYGDAAALQKAGIMLNEPDRGGSRRPMTWHEGAVKIARLLSQLTGPQSQARTDIETRLLTSPSAISALQDLVRQFRPELTRFNVDVDADQMRLAELSRTALRLLVAKPFPDVPPGHWAASSVEILRRNGLLVGYPRGTFSLSQ